MSVAALVGTLLAIGVAGFLSLYSTYLFVHRLRRKEPPFKTFFRWVRDLFDVASGLG
jgi:hypothetical protein